MKIQSIETFCLAQDLEARDAIAYSQKWYDRREAMIVRITTDDGVTGLGEAFGPAKVTSAVIEHVYKPLLTGRNPLAHRAIWTDLYNHLRDHGRKGLSVEALSAIDIALWDIRGKAAGMPVHALLGGGDKTSLPCYATGFYRRKVDDIRACFREEAATYREAGFSAVKMKVGFKDDVAMVHCVREALGPGTALMMDANHAFTADRAIQLAQAVEPCRISWFEEPVPPEDLEGYRKVHANTSIPLAGGEAEFTRFGFRRLLESHALDILQPDACVTGGITEVMRIADMAELYNVRILPHAWGSAVGLVASLHAAAAISDIPPSLDAPEILVEYDRTPNIFRDALCTAGPRYENGRLHWPEGPGLGLALNEAIVQRFRIP